MLPCKQAFTHAIPPPPSSLPPSPLSSFKLHIKSQYFLLRVVLVIPPMTNMLLKCFSFIQFLCKIIYSQPVVFLSIELNFIMLLLWCFVYLRCLTHGLIYKDYAIQMFWMVRQMNKLHTLYLTLCTFRVWKRKTWPWWEFWGSFCNKVAFELFSFFSGRMSRILSSKVVDSSSRNYL